MPEEVQITHVETVSDAEQLSAFLKSVWVSDEDVVPFDLILAMNHVGGYAAVAKLHNKIVAGSLGFRGEYKSRQILHSHVTASIAPGAGLLIKQHQLEWAKSNNLAAITWTFDPLVRRNCVFNFEKLSAIAVEYLPNFYGTMHDQINAGDESDRLFAYWALDSAETGRTEDTREVGLKNIDGKPVLQEHNFDSAFLVELPEDIEYLRKVDIELARKWRLAVREILSPKLNSGWTIGKVSADRKAVLVEPQNKGN